MKRILYHIYPVRMLVFIYLFIFIGNYIGNYACINV